MKRILEPGTNCLLSHADAAGVFVDARAYYRAFYEAALRAEHFILICGWQFDSDVRLLRGEDERLAEGDTRFLPFLDSLCRRKKGLQVRILAWDFSVIYTLEREWMQQWVFNWNTSDSLRFEFDGHHPLGASHHQKFIVIDGVVAFVGGADVCAHRWDDSDHVPHHPLRRDEDGTVYGPYHEIQAGVSGPVVQDLQRLFVQRWTRACDRSLDLPDVREVPPEPVATLPLPTVWLPGGPIAVSRTSTTFADGHWTTVSEVLQLFERAIALAERTIYLETQYLSSRALVSALTKRMRDAALPQLDIVVLLPEKPEALKEEVAVGILQAKALWALHETARSTGHRLGFFNSVPLDDSGAACATYIHSKLLIVDDRFLSVGSANATNRSMGVDSELNLSWEALDRGPLVDAIRDLRIRLLCEHIGRTATDEPRVAASRGNLVDALRQLAAEPGNRLSIHEVEPPLVLETLGLDEINVDPESPLESTFEDAPSADGFFARAIDGFKRALSPAMNEDSSNS